MNIMYYKKSMDCHSHGWGLWRAHQPKTSWFSSGWLAPQEGPRVHPGLITCDSQGILDLGQTLGKHGMWMMWCGCMWFCKSPGILMYFELFWYHDVKIIRNILIVYCNCSIALMNIVGGTSCRNRSRSTSQKHLVPQQYGAAPCSCL